MPALMARRNAPRWNGRIWRCRVLSLLGKDHDRVSFADPLGGEVERLHGGTAVLAIDRDEAGAPEGPAEDRDLEEARPWP